MRRVRIRTFPQRGRSPTALRWGAALRDHDHRRGSDRLERKSPRRPEHDHQGRSSLCDAKHRQTACLWCMAKRLPDSTKALCGVGAKGREEESRLRHRGICRHRVPHRSVCSRPDAQPDRQGRRRPEFVDR